MADGMYLPIDEIEVVDPVAATDPETGVRSAQPVLDLVTGYGAKHLVAISTSASLEDPLIATAQHPVWVEGRGWTDAGAVQVGDLVVSSTGESRAVSAVFDAGVLENQLVYNLSVGNAHTFTVLDDGGEILVHNSCGRGGKQQRLKDLLNDPKQPRHVRGWVKQEMDSIARKSKNKRGNPRKTVRIPPGYELAHLRGKEAHKGFDYSHPCPTPRCCTSSSTKYDNNGKGRRR